MFEGTDLTALNLYQDPQAALKNKIGNFDQAYLQKAYTRAQGKDVETVTITSRSRHIGRKLKARINTTPPSGFNREPAKDTYITLVITQEDVEDEDISLLGRSSLALELAGDALCSYWKSSVSVPL